MLMASFYSCRINKNNTEVTNIEFEYLDIIIRNNSDTVYYFNKTDIENPACFVDYIDDKKKIKIFNFSMIPDRHEVKNDMTIHASSFSYKLNPLDVITLKISLEQDIDEYYHINLDETDFTVTKTLIGNALEKQFYMYCSKETLEYSSWFSDYSKKLQQYGEKIQGTMIGERNVLFEFN